jgi:hypothetical protein
LIDAARYGMIYTVQRLLFEGTVDVNAKDEVIITNI